MARGKEEGMARLSTLTHGQINIQGRYIFILPSLLKFEKNGMGMVTAISIRGSVGFSKHILKLL
jgi:hypothetical protein